MSTIQVCEGWVEEFPSAVQRYGREPDCAFMRREPGPETKAGARLASNGYFIHLIHIPARLWLTELCAGATALCVSTGRQAGERAGGREGGMTGGREGGRERGIGRYLRTLPVLHDLLIGVPAGEVTCTATVQVLHREDKGKTKKASRHVMV